MSKFFALVFILLASHLVAETAPTPLKLVRTLPHTGYSEGLDFFDGMLWHAVPKALMKINPASGEVLKTFQPATEYSESLVWFGDMLWNVSYSNNGIYAVPRKDVESAPNPQVVGDPIVLPWVRVGNTIEVHAWGLAHNGKELVFTGDHSSDKLYFFDPKQAKVVRTISVKDSEKNPVRDLEDLAWDGKRLWTSSFESREGQIFSVNPKNGKVLKFYTIPDPKECSIIDGIAYDGNYLWVTGKSCAKIYCFELPK